MASPTQKTYYNTPQNFCVQDTYKYMLAREISHNSYNVFEYFFIKERTGYNMI